MNISGYLCHVIGEDPKKTSHLHASTVRRMKAFAIAIHIPVILWAITGYIIASNIFKLDTAQSTGIAMVCAGLIYMVERLVLATPKVWYINLGRVLIGVVIALLGASTVDLVIFDREVSQQLRESGLERIRAQYEKIAAAKMLVVEQSKADWRTAQDAANCEANGTCGSRRRDVGPVYRALSRQAEVLRQDHLSAKITLDAVEQQREVELSAFQQSSQFNDQAGLLARVEALHQYTVNNNAAFVAWMLFFALVLFLELMVVITKLVFGETVDDKIEAYREEISDHKATTYLDSVTSPVARARNLLAATYC